MPTGVSAGLSVFCSSGCHILFFFGRWPFLLSVPFPSSPESGSMEVSVPFSILITLSFPSYPDSRSMEVSVLFTILITLSLSHNELKWFLGFTLFPWRKKNINLIVYSSTSVGFSQSCFQVFITKDVIRCVFIFSSSSFVLFLKKLHFPVILVTYKNFTSQLSWLHIKSPSSPSSWQTMWDWK